MQRAAMPARPPATSRAVSSQTAELATSAPQNVTRSVFEMSSRNVNGRIANITATDAAKNRPQVRSRKRSAACTWPTPMSTEARKTMAVAGPALSTSASVMPVERQSSCVTGQPASANIPITASSAASGASAVAPRSAASMTGARRSVGAGLPKAVRSAAISQMRGHSECASAKVSVLP